MMTPMKLLKPNIDAFTLALGNDFSTTSLNKSAPKVTSEITTDPDFALMHGEDPCTYHDKKGVQSDFIKIFKVKLNKKVNCSLALVFGYIDLPAEEHTMHYSLKVQDKEKGEDHFFKSADMELSQMRQLLNQAVQKIMAEHLNNEQKVFVVNEVFLSPQLKGMANSLVEGHPDLVDGLLKKYGFKA